MTVFNLKYLSIRNTDVVAIILSQESSEECLVQIKWNTLTQNGQEIKILSCTIFYVDGGEGNFLLNKNV